MFSWILVVSDFSCFEGSILFFSYYSFLLTLTLSLRMSGSSGGFQAPRGRASQKSSGASSGQAATLTSPCTRRQLFLVNLRIIYPQTKQPAAVHQLSGIQHSQKKRSLFPLKFFSLSFSRSYALVSLEPVLLTSEDLMIIMILTEIQSLKSARLKCRRV